MFLAQLIHHLAAALELDVGKLKRYVQLRHQHFFKWANHLLPATFQIIDSADQLSAIKRLMKLMNVDDEKFPPKQVMGYINSCKEEGLRAHTVDAYDPHSQRMREIFEEYDKQCQREGVVDFAELLLRCYELLIRDSNIRQHYQDRFKYILVDEFQDTNKLQYLWLKLFAGT